MRGVQRQYKCVFKIWNNSSFEQCCAGHEGLYLLNATKFWLRLLLNAETSSCSSWSWLQRIHCVCDLNTWDTIQNYLILALKWPRINKQYDPWSQRYSFLNHQYNQNSPQEESIEFWELWVRGSRFACSPLFLTVHC